VIPDQTPDFVKITRVYDVDVMEKWGAKAKDIQGQVFRIVSSNESRSNSEQFALQRAALLAFERGCKAFTILSSDETSSSQDLYVPGSGRVVEDRTTIRDSKGNIVGTASSNQRWEGQTRQHTFYKRDMTIQILKDENDTRFNNIYLVSKYLPQFFRVTGLKDLTGRVSVSLFKQMDMEGRECTGVISNGTVYFKFSDGKGWPESGQYYIVFRTGYNNTKKEYTQFYYFTNGKSFEQLGITNETTEEQDAALIPKYNITNQPIWLSFDWFANIEGE
jgi:hypothetical protein